MMTKRFEPGLAKVMATILIASLAALIAGFLLSGGEIAIGKELTPWKLSGEEFSSTLVHAGILILLALPMLRSLWLAGKFVREREWRSAAVAGAVAILIVAAAVVGLVT